MVISKSLLNSLPLMVQNEIQKLSEQSQKAFLEEYKRKKKTKRFAYFLWFMLGWHYGYLNKWGVQYLYWISIGGLFFWLILDIFRIPSLVKNYNKDIAIEILKNIKTIS